MKIKRYKKLIVSTILSIILILLAFFWIPILSVFNVSIPKILVLFNLVFVALSSIPLAVCIIKIYTKSK